MRRYDNDYFFIIKKQDDRLPFLVPDENTAERNFSFEAQPSESNPLVFYNGWKEQDKKRNIAGITPDILFSGNDMVVRTSIYSRLLAADIPDLHMHPAVYIDDKDKWNEDYWFLTFTSRFDCWDRDASEYNQESPPIELDGKDYYKVFNFSLDEKVIEGRQLQERCLFKMGGSLQALITCHRSLISVFSSEKNGAEITGIADY
jgi:hypothetical protein